MTRAQRKYWDYVAQLPCQLCGARGVQIAHRDYGKGMGQKTHWFDVAPLCDPCHDELTDGHEYSLDQKRALMDRAIVNTHERAMREGILEVK